MADQSVRGLPIPETPKALRVFNGVIGELLSRGNYVHVYPEGVLYPYYLKGIRSFTAALLNTPMMRTSLLSQWLLPFESKRD